MTDIKKLLKRLRAMAWEMAKWDDDWHVCGGEANNIRDLCDAMEERSQGCVECSEVEYLRAELASVKHEIEGWKKTVVDLTREKYAAEHKVDLLEAELARVKHRARRAGQILIEEIGAPGPEGVDETARRAVEELARVKAEVPCPECAEVWLSPDGVLLGNGESFVEHGDMETGHRWRTTHKCPACNGTGKKYGGG